MPREPAQPSSSSDGKFAALAASGTLNRTPQAVRDPLFRSGGFFDPHDLLQLRYEMVRRHRVENLSVAATAELFGVSLPTAYQAHAAFAAGGLAGLLPKRRGPKQGHKLTPEILAHIEQRRRERPDWRAREVQTELQQCFGLTVHRRSVERVLQGQKNRCSVRNASTPAARCRRLRDAAQRGAAQRPQPRPHAPAARSRRLADRGVSAAAAAIAEPGITVGRGRLPRITAGGSRSDCLSSEPGGSSCVMHALRPTI